MVAPANKLFMFGKDYNPVKLAPGHASIARQSLAQGIMKLVHEKWLDIDEAPERIDRIMRGNADALCDYENTLEHWRARRETT